MQHSGPAINTSLPRVVPASVKYVLLFSTPLAWVGLFFFVFSLAGIILGVRAPQKFFFPGTTDNVTAIATVTRVHKITGAGNAVIYDYEYEFTAKDGRKYAGRGQQNDEGPSEGDRIVVEYNPKFPEFSFVKQKQALVPSNADTPFIQLYFMLVPGLVLIVVAVRSGNKKLKLLREGLVVYGIVVAREETPARKGKRNVFLLHFEYRASDGEAYQASLRTHRPDLYDNGSPQALLLNPNLPEGAILVDTLPRAVRQFIYGSVTGAEF